MPETDLKLKVRQTIQTHGLVSASDKVLLGLSGGPDSMCLLDILNKLQRPLGFSLFAFHVNHGIRGLDADGDEASLTEYCKACGIPFSSIKTDIPSSAKEHGKSLEEEGRNFRYEALKKEAVRIGANRIALAHNKNDRAETILMRILRGTGVSGLCGMDYKREDGIIRPLLDADRNEIELYCSENKLPFLVDKTNADTEYTRNRVRIELLPFIQEKFNPNISDSLIRLSESAAADEAVLSKLSEKSRTNDVKLLAEMPQALFSRVVVLLFKDKGLTEDISAVHINALRGAVIKNVGGKTIEFPHGYKAIIKNGKVLISNGQDIPI